MNYQSREVPASYFGVPDELYSALTLDLDEEANTVTIVFIKSKEEHKGSFRKLLAALEASPYDVRIYCPIRRTRGIIARLGYGPMNPDMWVHGYPADFEDIKYGMSTSKYAMTADSVYD